MNYKKFAEQWYEGAPANEDNMSRVNGLATTIDKHFVSRDALEILKTRCDAAIVSIGNNVSVGNPGGVDDRLWGEVEGVRLVLSYLAEMEDGQ